MSEEKLNRADPDYAEVRASIVELLKAARATSARSVNALRTATYWEVGRRIVESEMRGEKRADYGERLVERLAIDLSKQFGRGFGKISLWRMRAFFQAWPGYTSLCSRHVVRKPCHSLRQFSPPLVGLPAPAFRQESRSTEVLRGRSHTSGMVGLTIRPANRKPVL